MKKLVSAAAASGALVASGGVVAPATATMAVGHGSHQVNVTTKPHEQSWCEEALTALKAAGLLSPEGVEAAQGTSCAEFFSTQTGSPLNVPQDRGKQLGLQKRDSDAADQASGAADDGTDESDGGKSRHNRYRRHQDGDRDDSDGNYQHDSDRDYDRDSDGDYQHHDSDRDYGDRDSDRDHRHDDGDREGGYHHRG